MKRKKIAIFNIALCLVILNFAACGDDPAVQGASGSDVTLMPAISTSCGGEECIK